MLKMLGAGLIIISTSFCGVRAVKLLSGRVNSLSSLISALEMLEAEMSFRLSPLPDAAVAVSKRASMPADLLFKNFSENLQSLGDENISEIWSSSVEETPRLLLRRDEKQVLKELGAVLGRFDLEQQKAAFQLAGSRLAPLFERAVAEREKQGRLYGTLGVASGVLAAIVLI